MDRLIAGHKRFLAEVFPGRRAQFHLLAEGQAPEWLFITCSDSRVLPDLILGTGPGDLFITRNAGNVVAQLSNLKAQPAVVHALGEGRLTVHGWYYDILSGRIEEYDEGVGGFRALVG